MVNKYYQENKEKHQKEEKYQNLSEKDKEKNAKKGSRQI